MLNTNPEKAEYLSQKFRILALFANVIIIIIACYMITGEWFPLNSGKKLWILSALGYWLFVLLSSPWFSPPRDSLVNSVTAILLLIFIDFVGVNYIVKELNIFRWIAIGLSSITAISALTSMAFKDTDSTKKPLLNFLSKVTYRISFSFGKGEIIFTPPALISIVGFYQTNPVQQLWLMFLWVLLIVVKPIELVLQNWILIRNIRSRLEDKKHIGQISRVDHPDIIRVILDDSVDWPSGEIFIGCLPNGKQVQILTLFKHLQESQFIGTGFFCGSPEENIADALPQHVYKPVNEINSKNILCKLCGKTKDVELIGFVVEDSNISSIKFEITPNISLREGMLVFCHQNRIDVFYQILDAKITEETIKSNPRGKHIVTASQLGCIHSQRGFVKYGWLPTMNCPVFRSNIPIKLDDFKPNYDELQIGTIPGSEVPVYVSFNNLQEFHTAILGITGTGKTELALDIIRKGLTLNSKIFCVDFTGEYQARLKDNNPQFLGLSHKQAEEFNNKLFDVDTGKYGAPDEKKALKKFVEDIRKPIIKKIDKFLSSEDYALGIFELPEIINTKATLRATELYLSSIMEWARDHRRAKKIFIVLEEAHTIVPETMGSGFDYDTQWVVGRITQIALQGRKFGVGLMVISQRTALVSKSILTQCNTHFTFSLIDKTSLDFLSNVYSQEHVRKISNLKFLQLMTFGKAIHSERPLIVELEYSPTKKLASEELNELIVSSSNKEISGLDLEEKSENESSE